jgi:lysophospholipase L1-like esterase
MLKMKVTNIKWLLGAILCLSSQFVNAQDWANLKRFQEDNLKLSAPTPNEKRVVFMGNSITEGWKNISPEFFAGRPYINRGISGQTTPQMLIRFHQDVVNLKPKVVVMLCGINDIAGNTGPSSLEMIEDNIAAMAEIARANKISVVLSSVLPAFDFPWKPGLEPANKVIALNIWIKSYASQHKLIYLDYFSVMKDERNGLPKNLATDGIHPTKAGYDIMEPLAEKAIALAMKQKIK